MLVTWLIELYLNHLGVLKEQGNDTSDQYDILQEEFRKFLARPSVKVSCLQTLSSANIVCTDIICACDCVAKS